MNVDHFVSVIVYIGQVFHYKFGVTRFKVKTYVYSGGMNLFSWDMGMRHKVKECGTAWFQRPPLPESQFGIYAVNCILHMDM